MPCLQRISRAIPPLAATIAVGALIASCASTPPPRTAPVASPGSFRSAGEQPGASDAPADSMGWWRDFDDPELNRLVGLALGGNFSLRAAWSRYRQAEAMARQAGAGRLPAVTASGTAGRSRSYTGIAIPGFAPTQTQERYGVSVGAQYELDIWGRLADLDRAAGYDAQATRFDVEALAMTLAAGTAETWYALNAQMETRDLLQRQARTDSVSLELVTLRFAGGLAPAVEVFQQRQQLLATRAEMPGIEARITVLENQLAVLTGQPPGSISVASPDSRASVPPVPAAGLPIDVLDARPDVQSAWLRLHAADHRVAAAAKNRLPALRLDGSLGLQSGSVSTLLDEWVYSISAGIVAPLFDGGRRRAAVELQRAAVEGQLAALGATLLTAMREVDDALALESREVEHLERIRAQVGVSEQLLEEARLRYQAGLSDYLPVLTATQALHRVQRAEVGSRRQLASYRVQLHRALGGTWTQHLQPDTPVGINSSAHSEVEG